MFPWNKAVSLQGQVRCLFKKIKKIKKEDRILIFSRASCTGIPERPGRIVVVANPGLFSALDPTN